ncbi:sensor histidine kinase [Chloroflexota bacterium]
MSLRIRFILSFTLVVFLCLTVAAISVTVVLQTSRDRLATSRLNDIARPIYVQVLALARGQETWADVVTNLREQAQKNEVYIFIADADGNIIRQVTPDASTPQISVAETSTARERIIIPPEELPQNVTQPMGGTFESSEGETFLYAAYSLGKQFDYQKQYRFETLILAVPRGAPITILAGLALPFFWAGLVAFIISVVIAILLARSTYQPIQRVTEAVDRLAEGQYDQEIPVAGPKEIRILASRFNEMLSKVKQSQQQLRYFVADVSHQLRTPLTSIQGFAQAMLDGTANDTETRQKAARVIDDESKRMIRQVEELLELSRMQSGQLEMAQELIDLKELLLHCQEIFHPQAEEKGILFRADIEPLVPVTGDVDRLEQVFSNLLDNALKNTPVKGEVSIAGRNSASGTVEITISDTGPGIPPEQLPYVFERFYQAGGLRTGYGLGLAIAREIVATHGGKIEAHSSPGEGTQFVVTLPASIPTP